jgi:hypothetical protein
MPGTHAFPARGDDQDALTGELQHTLAALADVEFAFRSQRERLDRWPGPREQKDRLAAQAETERQRRRAPLIRQLDALQARVIAMTLGNVLH